MKRLLLSLLLVTGFAFAQTQTTPNLVGTNVNPAPDGVTYQWSGFVNTTSTGGGYSGGNQPGYNATTGQFMFGYSQGTIAYQFAINSALSGSGIQIGGMEYGATYYNQGDYVGTLSATASILSPTGSVLQSYTHNLPQTTSGWTPWSQSQTFTSPYSLADVGDGKLSFTGKDSKFWAGYYGPQFKDPFFKLTYTADLCASNPLSDPSCPGYAAAYQSQQCTANPLYDQTCPGYAAAFFTQQCSANALYDPTCPGYASAYLNQQCTQNALYSPSCPGYETAYFNQQCTLNGLYNSRCPNYQSAYFTQQCNLDGLYSTSCPNYATAYAKKTLFEQQGIASAVDTAGTIAKNDPTKQTASVGGTSSAGSVSATGTLSDPTSVNPTSDTTVNERLKENNKPPENRAEPRKDNPGAPGGPGPGPQQASNQPPPPQQGQGEKQQPQTKREELAQQRKEAAQKEAVAKGKDLAKNMGDAVSMEQQKQIQNVVLSAMAYVPGFDNYGKTIVPDAQFYAPREVYKNQVTVDNRRARLGLSMGSDLTHEKMVNSQYKD